MNLTAVPPYQTQPSLSTEVLDKYVAAFKKLHVSQSNRLGPAPHKPILLLAIIDGIHHGWIRDNRIGLTPELIAAFFWHWRARVSVDGLRQPRIIYPFRYLAGEKTSFWHFERDGVEVTPQFLAHPTSVAQINEKVDYARLDPELWRLLQDPASREALRSTLMTTYFGAHLTVEAGEAMLPADPLEAEIERLIEQSRTLRYRATPQPNAVRESDEGYLRHHLFSRVVTRIYAESCAVCRTSAKDSTGRVIVDAAHIRPFARFGDDSPQNGLALCKNHHFAFDAGWFSIRPDYTVVTSRSVRGLDGLVQAGTALQLPSRPYLAPSPEALAWHLAHTLLRP